MKKLLRFVLPVLIIVLAVAGFIFFNKNEVFNKKKGEEEIKNGENQEKTITEQNLPSGWKNFSKEDVPYTFNYPQEVSLLKEDRYYLSLKGPTQKEETEGYDGLALGFSDPLKLEGKTLSEYVAQKIQSNQEFEEVTKPQEAITINGLTGLTYTASGLGKTQYIFLPVPGKDQVIEISNSTQDPTNQGYQETVQKILATFSFIQ